jgi:hypothetical protein
LLDGVAEVARHAAEDSDCLPDAVSKGAWDRARLASERTDLPTAEGARKRLDRTWPEVLKMALGVPASRMHRRGVLAARAVFRGDDRLIIPALRWAALQLGHTPRPAEYDLEVEAWNARAQTERPRPLLPVSETILRRMPWADAIRRAGLAPLGESGVRRAQPLTDLIDRCISETGVLPTKAWFRQWARLNDVRVGRQVAVQWGHALQETLRLRRRRGDAIPDRDEPLPLLPAAPTRSAEHYTRDDALRSLRTYGNRYLRPGQGPRFKHYQVCSAGDPELVSSPILQRYGRFQDLCREAAL